MKPKKIIFLAGEDTYILSYRLPTIRAAARAGYEVHIVAQDTGQGQDAVNKQKSSCKFSAYFMKNPEAAIKLSSLCGSITNTLCRWLRSIISIKFPLSSLSLKGSTLCGQINRKLKID